MQQRAPVDGVVRDDDEPSTGDLQDLACAVSDLLYGGELGWTHHPMSKTIADLRGRLRPKVSWWRRMWGVRGG